MGYAQQAHEEGRQEGRQEGQASILRAQLIARFGRLTRNQQQRLEAMDDEAMHAAAVWLIDATSVDEVLG